MSAAGALNDPKVSYIALMKRELGKPTRPINSVLDPPAVPPKEDNSLKDSIQQPCCLVTKKLSPWMEEDAEKERAKLYNLQIGPIRITFAELRGIFGTGKLLKCYKKVMNYKGNGDGPFTRKQIIPGILLRAGELYAIDSEDFKKYVQEQTEHLERIFRNYLRDKTNSLYLSILLIEQI